MRILHFFKTYWPDTFGGVERTIHAIAEGTREFGFESSVLSLSATPEASTKQLDGHMAYKAKLDFEIASTGLSRDVFQRFRTLSETADIVHFHFPWPMMDLVHLTVKHGKPTVLTYHSDIVKQKLLGTLYKPLMYRFLNSMDHIVATSPNYLKSSEVLQAFKAKTSVIPLGLNEADYPASNTATRTYWRARLPERFFLFVGVLRYYKGIQILLEAARLSDLDVVIIGDGPMEASLKETAGTQNLGKVLFLGAVSDADKIAILELSLCLVFPSHLRSEAFGLSLVEAALLGKPMISCEIGTGTSFVNLDGVTGIVVKPNDPDTLAEAMRRLWDDSNAVREFGLAARLRYERHFTARAMGKAYAKLYRQLSKRDSDSTA